MSDSAQQNQFYISRGEKEEGPFNRAQILKMLANGEIEGSTFYAAVGMETWKTVEELKREADLESEQESMKTVWGLVLGICVLAIVVGGWKLSTPHRAGKAAIAHIIAQIPGGEAKCKVVSIEEDGAEYFARLEVDGKNAFGGWVRKNAEVRLRSDPVGFTVINWKIED